MKSMTRLLLIGGCIFYAFTARAELIPRSVPADSRIKMVVYDPNNVVVIHGRYGYQTQIVFADTETVQNVSIGDGLAWQTVPVNNHLFVKPMAESNTNMTVLTNTNSYSFQLDSTHASVVPTYKLQFIYPATGYSTLRNTKGIGLCEPTQINWKYSFTGDRALAPIEAFDCDGKFTYFRFKGSVPAIFMHAKDQKETLVNYHMQGDYVVVNAGAKQFTLRNGHYVTTVYND